MNVGDIIKWDDQGKERKGKIVEVLPEPDMYMMKLGKRTIPVMIETEYFKYGLPYEPINMDLR